MDCPPGQDRPTTFGNYDPDIEILVVCTGNICRSPMGEVLLRDGTRAAGLDLTVSSAGSLFDGRGAEPAAVAAMQKRNLDLRGHRSRIFDAALIEQVDLVIGMEQQHVRQVSLLVPVAFRRAFTLPDLVLRAEAAGPRRVPWADWIRELGADRTPSHVLADRPDLEVADPIGGSGREFRRCADELAGLIERFVPLAWPGGRSTGNHAVAPRLTPRSV